MSDATRKTQSTGDRGEILEKRLAIYASRVLRVCDELPQTRPGRHVRDQLLRSATAPGAHYAEARSAQSIDDFIHKTALAAKEARESRYWLRVATHGFTDAELSPPLDEASELVAILFRSVQTARENRGS